MVQWQRLATTTLWVRARLGFGCCKGLRFWVVKAFGSKAAWRPANSQELAGLPAAVHKKRHELARIFWGMMINQVASG
jgi:hypothetical protein